jgi:hypothetical protein
MNLLYKTTTLVLDARWMPCGTKTAKEALVMMFSGIEDFGKRQPPALALNFEYPYGGDEGGYDTENPSSYEPVNWETWLTLPVRECDDFVSTSKMKIRIPTVLIAANFAPKKVLVHKPRPTKRRIYERDKGVCQYSKRKLSFHEATLDHVHPKSRGGRNEFKNLALCAPEVNLLKANRTPEEAGFSRPILKEPPHLPISATITNFVGCPDWDHFLHRKRK